MLHAFQGKLGLFCCPTNKHSLANSEQVLRCSHCGWYEPVDSAMIDQRRRREDLPTPERPEASAQQHAFFPGSSSQQTDIPNVRPQPHIPPPRKSDEAPPPYSYK